MSSERARGRCRERLISLSHSSVDSDSLAREAILELSRAVGFERWCLVLSDPGSLIETSGFAEHDFFADLPHLLTIEQLEPDVNKHALLARQPRSRRSVAVGHRRGSSAQRPLA
jgi:hypothetical protein